MLTMARNADTVGMEMMRVAVHIVSDARSGHGGMDPQVGWLLALRLLSPRVGPADG